MARTFHNFLSPLAGGSAVEAFQPSPRLARALLNSAAPVLEDRCAPSRRNCMASRALIGGGALLRIASLSSLASQSGMKRPRGKERFGFLGTRNALPLAGKRAEKQ